MSIEHTFNKQLTRRELLKHTLIAPFYTSNVISHERMNSSLAYAVAYASVAGTWGAIHESVKEDATAQSVLKKSGLYAMAGGAFGILRHFMNTKSSQS